MRNLILFAGLVFGIESFALESNFELHKEELMKNDTVARGGVKQSNVTAARVIQLQVQASKCQKPLVMAMDFETPSDGKCNFKLTSENCILRSKKEQCDPGFAAHNMTVNPNTPDEHIIGNDLYKICIKSSNGLTSTPAASK